MRLRHLDLIRYGRFTDRRLDFGAGGGDSDVTIVYGANEAGKSTAFAAWLDLLFGMPNQHPYDFVHPRKDLLVGATIETGQGALALRRTGQRTGSLTDENGHTVDERRLSLLLHGLDRDSYRTRFSLNDEVLRQGGAEIAQAKGDLGQLLHAGAHDAWVTPIVMKKGRPAYTVSALCSPTDADVIRRVMFVETSTIGLRETMIRKFVLPRDERHVDVGGHAVGVKTAYLDGQPVNRSVEWDDVAAAATALGLSAKDVLDAATSAAREPS